MKKILITGAHSYIGTQFEQYLSKDCALYEVSTIDMRTDSWRSTDFGVYDTVFHVAGLAHVSSDPALKEHYYKINRDLAIETAKKAHSDGARQFVFMSSMIVYNGISVSQRKNGITAQTQPVTNDFYGDSKLQADIAIQALQSASFAVAILRPPMIFGLGCKGNFPRLATLASRTPLFPLIQNKRSMLYVENLCALIKILIDTGTQGIFFPQNADYFETSALVKKIAQLHGKKIILSPVFALPILIVRPFVTMLNKVFGDLYYDTHMSQGESHFNGSYQIVDNDESIKRSI